MCARTNSLTYRELRFANIYVWICMFYAYLCPSGANYAIFFNAVYCHATPALNEAFAPAPPRDYTGKYHTPRGHRHEGDIEGTTPIIPETPLERIGVK